jgi:Flp pilus assembly protein TadB
MRGAKEHQEICVVGRLFSLEALIFLMGVVSLVYGLVTARLSNIIIGALVLAAAVLLARVWRRTQLK